MEDTQKELRELKKRLDRMEDKAAAQEHVEQRAALWGVFYGAGWCAALKSANVPANSPLFINNIKYPWRESAVAAVQNQLPGVYLLSGRPCPLDGARLEKLGQMIKDVKIRSNSVVCTEHHAKTFVASLKDRLGQELSTDCFGIRVCKNNFSCLIYLK